MNRSPAGRPPVRRLELTEAGRLVALLALLAFIVDVAGAGSTRLAAATGLAALGSAYVFAALATRGLRVEPPGPQRPFVDERIELTFTVHATRFLALRDLVLTLEKNRRASVSLAEVRAGRAQRVELMHRFTRRGVHRALRVTATTTRPFGLVRAQADLDLPIDVVALPRPLPLAFSDPPPGRSELERVEATCAGDEDYYALRDWRVGESPRRIHWKSSARRGRLVRLETRRRAARPAVVVLSLFAPLGSKAGLFERALRVAAGLAVRALAARRPLRLIVLGPGGFELGPLKGRADRLRLLEELARVEMTTGDPLEEVRTWLAQHPQRDPPEVVFVGSPDAHVDAPPGWIDVRDVLAAGRPRFGRRRLEALAR